MEGAPFLAYGPRCKACRKDFSVASMGKRAVLSHMESEKHISNLTRYCCSTKLKKTSTGKLILESPSGDRNQQITAEVRYLLNLLQKDQSMNSLVGANAMLCQMFLDSAIASRFSLSRTKGTYLLNHGLAPYYQTRLLYDIKESRSSKFSVLFDESLNNSFQTEQMDILVKFWNNDVVETQYFSSVFMGHTTAADLKGAFKTAIAPLPSWENIVQI